MWVRNAEKAVTYITAHHHQISQEKVNLQPKCFQNWYIIPTTSSVDTVKWYEIYWQMA